MGFESIGAIQKCMEFLNLNAHQERTHTVEARIYNNNKAGLIGPIDVISIQTGMQAKAHLSSSGTK